MIQLKCPNYFWLGLQICCRSRCQKYDIQFSMNVLTHASLLTVTFEDNMSFPSTRSKSWSHAHIIVCKISAFVQASETKNTTKVTVQKFAGQMSSQHPAHQWREKISNKNLLNKTEHEALDDDELMHIQR